MSALETEVYEQQRKRWRRRGFWRGALVVAVIAGAIAVVVNLDALRPERDQIARVGIEGVISDDRAREKLLADIAEDDSVRAVILRINSPGGTIAGSEGLHEAVRALGREKPVVAVMSETAASGGYVAALGAEHIVARATTMTGSIGVIMEYPDITEVLGQLGIGVETLRSSELKAEPAPWRETSPEARDWSETLIADSQDWFRELVAERRDLSGSELDAVTDGRVFTGRMALESGLIDTIGGEDAARNWLEERDGDLADLPVRDHSVPRPGLLSRLTRGELPGAGSLLGDLTQRAAPELRAILR